MQEYKISLDVSQVYYGSNGEDTKKLYTELEKHGIQGLLALNLFRTCKCSVRAKVYRGGVRGLGSFKDLAYERKQWSMNNLCDILIEHADKLNIKWGWKQDPKQEYHKWILYIETPQGQCSFHTAQKGKGNDYTGEWDGQHASEKRIIKWVEQILSE
jgi:hypothetical protein